MSHSSAKKEIGATLLFFIVGMVVVYLAILVIVPHHKKTVEYTVLLQGTKDFSIQKPVLFSGGVEIGYVDRIKNVPGGIIFYVNIYEETVLTEAYEFYLYAQNILAGLYYIGVRYQEGVPEENRLDPTKMYILQMEDQSSQIKNFLETTKRVSDGIRETFAK